MLQCWRSNPKDRPSFQGLTHQLSTILSNLIQAQPSTNESASGGHDMMARDSYLHPMEESDVQDDATRQNTLLNSQEPNRDSYLQPMEGNSNPVYLELL